MTLNNLPEINLLLEKRNALKLDSDSYTRRAKAELDKDPGSASASKLVNKRDTAATKLNEVPRIHPRPCSLLPIRPGPLTLAPLTPR